MTSQVKPIMEPQYTATASHIEIVVHRNKDYPNIKFEDPHTIHNSFYKKVEYLAESKFMHSLNGFVDYIMCNIRSESPSILPLTTKDLNEKEKDICYYSTKDELSMAELGLLGVTQYPPIK